MALYLRLSPLSRMPPSLRSSRRKAPPPMQRLQALSPTTPLPALRRTANFHPTMFDDAFVQSLGTVSFKDDAHAMRRKLIDDVGRLIQEEKGLIDQLELLDSLQQLGVAYLFEKQIKRALSRMHSLFHISNGSLQDDVHAASLLFRLLREHGFAVSKDVLVKSFKDEHGVFKPNTLSEAEGLLSFYEATFLAEAGEEELDEGRRFAAKRLTELRLSAADGDEDDDLGDDDRLLEKRIDRALELPLHWRTPRLHSLWFIAAYGRKEGMEPKLLELAKLDFNMVQNVYRVELKEVSRWWRKLGMANGKLRFARDWPVESYIWTVGLASEPQFSRLRIELAKVVCFLHIVDDIYDVYGSLEELEVLTEAIDRWELAAMDELPAYMKSSFLALFNTVNEIACSIYKNKGLDVLHYLKRAWSDICKAFLQEARWYNAGYVPTLEEYMNNAWISVAAPLTLVFSQCLSEDLTKGSLEKLKFYPPMTYYSSTIFRLYDDLGTSKAELQRGDVAKSIQCCMNEKQVTETAACEKMKDLIDENWKFLNGENVANSELEESFKRVAMNLPRMAQFMYDNRDGDGKPNRRMQDLITSLLIEPIPL